MFTFFSRQGRVRQKQAIALYKAAALAAREPQFYTDFGVPDTFDGRFEMLCLQVWLVMHKLKVAGEDKLAQALFDVMFRTMDQTIREIGVGDLSVPRHMKRMMTGFNGRANAYEAALVGEEKLEETLIRNVYATADNIEQGRVQALALYVRQVVEGNPKEEQDDEQKTGKTAGQ